MAQSGDEVNCGTAPEVGSERSVSLWIGEELQETLRRGDCELSSHAGTHSNAEVRHRSGECIQGTRSI